ncbi:MAG: CDP-alcohol phosphatidyltransferase family protein [Actinobacteria bacterium]|nr:CDP-alcohol phosphatidyltransferase family protein [Actinomycetota bacterium]MCL6105523.1 CDP-alcohol phosphatidyltransferase family protein [Actinomycetota bacterium]
MNKGTEPIGRVLKRCGIKPNVLTLGGLVLAGISAFYIANGDLHIGLIFLVLCGFSDLLDGPLAKAWGTASAQGAFLDSVVDRVSDAFLLGGVGWYLIITKAGLYLSTYHSVAGGAVGAKSRLALDGVLPLAVLGITFLVSYQRAKAESLGFNAKGGLMERAERFVLLGFGLLVGSLLLWVLWILLILTLVTALQRFFVVWKQAGMSQGSRTSKYQISKYWTPKLQILKYQMPDISQMKRFEMRFVAWQAKTQARQAKAEERRAARRRSRELARHTRVRHLPRRKELFSFKRSARLSSSASSSSATSSSASSSSASSSSASSSSASSSKLAEHDRFDDSSHFNTDNFG